MVKHAPLESLATLNVSFVHFYSEVAGRSMFQGALKSVLPFGFFF